MFFNGQMDKQIVVNQHNSIENYWAKDWTIAILNHLDQSQGNVSEVYILYDIYFYYFLKNTNL